MADEVKWQFNVSKWDGQLAECGKWIAELGYDPYSEALVIVKYMDNAPAYWGQDKALPEPENAVALIDAMSKIMVRGLECSQHKDCRCQLVYVASMNEGDFKHVHEEKPLSVGLHFWLLPRYKHDMDFLNEKDDKGRKINDGFALMAEWRREFLLRQKEHGLPDWQKSKKKYPDEWAKNAKRIRAKLKKAVEESQKYC